MKVCTEIYELLLKERLYHMKMNDRSLLQLVYDDVSEACNGITTTFYSDITDPLLDIWSGTQILMQCVHMPQFPTKNPTWLKNIE